MKFFNKLFGNNKEETPDEKDGVLSVSKKSILKKVPLRWKLIAISLIGGIASFAFLAICISTLFTLESVNSTEVAGSKRYDSNTGNAYEQSVIEFQENNNITEYVDIDSEVNDAHEAYYDALFRAYEQYKAFKDGNFFDKIGGFFEGIFSRKKEAPTLNRNSDKGYGVQIDTSLISTTLYNSRFFGDMLFEDKQAEYYFDGNEYYDLHTTSFRDKVESKYFDLARSGADAGKLTIEGIEILAKYMIQRVETYYTLQKEYAGVYYDTTRHIKIVNSYIDMGNCADYLIDKSDIKFDHYRIGGGNYSWNNSLATDKIKEDELNQCKNMYKIEDYDDALYNPKSRNYEYSVGYEYLNYELDCDGYQKYLLTEYPLINDDYGNNHLEMFCGDSDSCYNDFFIPSYYYKYIDADVNSVDRVRQIEDIVFETYSSLEYYESSTLNFNVCRVGYSAEAFGGDASCGVIDSNGSVTTFDGAVADHCSFDGLMVRVFECSAAAPYDEDSFPGGSTIMNGLRVANKTISFEDYVKTVTIGEMYSSDPIESLKLQMLMIKSRIIHDVGSSSRVKMVNGELWIGMQSGCLHAYHYYKYTNLLNSKYKGKIDEAYAAIKDKVLYYKGSNDVFPSLFGNEGQAQLRELGKSGLNYVEILNNFSYNKDGIPYSSAEIRQCNASNSNGGTNALSW